MARSIITIMRVEERVEITSEHRQEIDMRKRAKVRNRFLKAKASQK